METRLEHRHVMIYQRNYVTSIYHKIYPCPNLVSIPLCNPYNYFLSNFLHSFIYLSHVISFIYQPYIRTFCYQLGPVYLLHCSYYTLYLATWQVQALCNYVNFQYQQAMSSSPHLQSSYHNADHWCILHFTIIPISMFSGAFVSGNASLRLVVILCCLQRSYHNVDTTLYHHTNFHVQWSFGQ